jgi:hypothetical protein
VEDHHEWPGLLLCFGLGDTDAPSFEYLVRTDWHRARSPEDLSQFFRTATLTLSPLPRNEGVTRGVYAAMVQAWVADKKARSEAAGGRKKPALGLEAVLHTAFNGRPDTPKRSRRPYAFGTKEEVRARYQRCSNTTATYDWCSEQYLAGNRSVIFPDGTYPPAVPHAA